MTYACTSTKGVYHITLTIYRDCSGIPLGSCTGTCGSTCSYTLNWASTDPGCSNTGTFSCSLTSVSDVGRNMNCANSKNICTNMGCETAGTYTPGVEKYVFEGNVTLDSTVLPATCCNVRIYWSECCRNGAISTGAAGANFYIESIINRCASANTPCNSSPVFANEPIIEICGGQAVTFNVGGIDPDHDSLSYALTPGLTGHGTAVYYNAPYSYLGPLPYALPINGPFPLGFHCDPQTGDIMFTPSYGASGSFVGIVAVTVYQWRKISGVTTLVGTTSRDIQMVLSTCNPNNPPRFTTIAQGSSTPTNNLSFKAIRGTQLCFDIYVKDTDFYPSHTPPISDTTYLTWDNSLSSLGVTFTKNYVDSTRRTNGPRQDSVKFCWTPPMTANPALPYIFSVTGKDSKCPNPGRVQRAISITVCDTPIGITFINTSDSCAKWKLGVSTFNNTAIYSAQWDVSNTKGVFDTSALTTFLSTTATNVIFNDTGKFIARLTLNLGTTIQKVAYDTINVVYKSMTLITTHSDTVFCSSKQTVYKSNVQLGRTPYTIIWKDSATSTTRSTLDSIILSNYTGKSTYYLTVKNSLNCIVKDSFHVQNFAAPIVSLPSSTSICNGNNKTFDAGTNSGNVKKYLWSTGDTTQTITRSDSNKFIVTVIDTIGCQTTSTANLYVNKVYPYAGNDTTVCGVKTITLHATGGQNYQWKNLNTNTIVAAKSSSPNIAVTPLSNTTYEVTVYATQNGLECSNKDTVIVFIHNLPVSLLPANMRICSGSSYILDPGNNSGNIKKYLWSTGDSSRTITRNDSNLFIVTLTDTNNCSLKDSMPLYVNKSIIAFAGNDTNICVSGTVNLHATGGQNYQWKNLNTNTIIAAKSANANTSALVSTTTSFEVTVYSTQSGVECSNIDTMIANVNPKPSTPVISGLSSVPRGQTNNFNVINNVGSTYNWFVGNGNINSGNGTNMVSVVFNNIGTGSLKVFETASTSCKSDTSVKTISVMAGVGINEIYNKGEIKIYPNPTNGLLTIEFETPEKNVDIEVLDLIGKSVLKTNSKHNGGVFQKLLDLSHLSEGNYFVKITAGEKITTVKVTVK